MIEIKAKAFYTINEIAELFKVNKKELDEIPSIEIGNIVYIEGKKVIDFLKRYDNLYDTLYPNI